MSEWECIQLNHHKDVGDTILDWESRGWRLHTYAVAQLRGSEINHYLLFEKNNK